MAGTGDELDGWIARRTGTASRLGAILDVCADCAVTIGLQVFLCLERAWPLCLLTANFVSICSFVLCLRVRGRVQTNTVGRYVGGVMMTLFLVAAVCTAIRPGTWEVIMRVAVVPVTMFVALSIFENLRIVLFSIRKRRCA